MSVNCITGNISKIKNVIWRKSKDEFYPVIVLDKSLYVNDVKTITLDTSYENMRLNRIGIGSEVLIDNQNGDFKSVNPHQNLFDNVDLPDNSYVDNHGRVLSHVNPELNVSESLYILKCHYGLKNFGEVKIKRLLSTHLINSEQIFLIQLFHADINKFYGVQGIGNNSIDEIKSALKDIMDNGLEVSVIIKSFMIKGMTNELAKELSHYYVARDSLSDKAQAYLPELERHHWENIIDVYSSNGIKLKF